MNGTLPCTGMLSQFLAGPLKDFTIILGTGIHVVAAHHFPFLLRMTHSVCVESPVTAARASHFRSPFDEIQMGIFSGLPILVTIIVPEMFPESFLF